MTVPGELEVLRKKALQVGVPARRSDTSLYTLLSECLVVCLKVERDGLHEEVRSALTITHENGKRQYVEKRTHVSTLVSRYVLGGVDNRNSVYRYARVLKVAMLEQVSPAHFVEWVKGKGGIARASLKPQTNEHVIKRIRAMKPGQTATVSKDDHGNLFIVLHT